MLENIECVRKHEREMLQMQMQMNLQVCRVLSQNIGVHPQQLQFLTPQSYQQLSNNVPQGSSTPVSTSLNQSLFQRNQYANCSFQNMATDFSSSLLSTETDASEKDDKTQKQL